MPDLLAIINLSGQVDLIINGWGTLSVVSESKITSSAVPPRLRAVSAVKFLIDRFPSPTTERKTVPTVRRISENLHRQDADASGSLNSVIESARLFGAIKGHESPSAPLSFARRGLEPSFRKPPHTQCLPPLEPLMHRGISEHCTRQPMSSVYVAYSAQPPRRFGYARSLPCCRRTAVLKHLHVKSKNHSSPSVPQPGGQHGPSGRRRPTGRLPKRSAS